MRGVNSKWIWSMRNAWLMITIVDCGVKVDSGWKQISGLFVKTNINGTPTWK